MTQSACNTTTTKVEADHLLHEALCAEDNETVEMLGAVLSMSDDEDHDDGREGHGSEDGYWSEDDIAVIKAYFENEEEDEEALVIFTQPSSIPKSKTSTYNPATFIFSTVPPSRRSVDEDRETVDLYFD